MSIINKYTSKAGFLTLFLLGVIALTGSATLASTPKPAPKKPVAARSATKETKKHKKAKSIKKKRHHHRRSSAKSVKKS